MKVDYGIEESLEDQPVILARPEGYYHMPLGTFD